MFLSVIVFLLNVFCFISNDFSLSDHFEQVQYNTDNDNNDSIVCIILINVAICTIKTILVSFMMYCKRETSHSYTIALNYKKFTLVNMAIFYFFFLLIIFTEIVHIKAIIPLFFTLFMQLTMLECYYYCVYKN